ncbi:MAG: haloacid dehalogenase [Candidatus Hepatoplasma vulgare]|nr:MAG: haloacid dehalogenase [Candidatus Hepatoplasma sp.]
MKFDNKKEIKIVFLDIDNTLTTEKNKFVVSLENKLAIKDIQRKKIYVILASGRNRDDVKIIWNQIHLNEFSKYIIYANGAGIEDLIENKKISSNRIDNGTYDKLIDYCLKNNFLFILSGNEIIWGKRSLSSLEKLFFKFFNRKYKKFDKDFKIEYTTDKFGIFMSLNKKKTIEEMEKMREKFPNLEITTSTKGLYVEITNENVNKAEAAKVVLDILKIKKESAMAIGDSMNDYKLLKLVGTSIVVKNGEKELKEIADYETLAAKDNGVMRILKEIN